MLNKIIVLTLSAFIISSCSEEPKVEIAAQEQIDQYTKEAKDCKDKKDGAKSASSSEPVIKNKDSTESVAQEVKKSVRDFTIMDDDIVLGDPNASVILVEYFSPTCPHCYLYHKNIFPLINKNYIATKKIAYVIREFAGNKQDLDAAILAKCNGNSDSYLKFVEVILQQQNNWAVSSKYREILTNIGVLGGVSVENYAKCLQNETIVKVIMDNTLLASKAKGFSGTPAFFINNKQFTKPYTDEELSKALDEAIKNVSAATKP